MPKSVRIVSRSLQISRRTSSTCEMLILSFLEGDWQPTRLVVLEFEDLATAKRWYESEVYQEAKKLRDGAAHLRMVAVQGVG
jgi:uncharacterized protein (DUF1330 family)